MQSSVAAAIGLLCLSSVSAQYSESLTGFNTLGDHFGVPFVDATYDYVVVGGGTSGLTIATRLAEGCGGCTIAVVEAGGFYEEDNGNLSIIPADLAHYLGRDPVMQNPLIDWMQETTPQAGLNGDTILYSRGKTLGGSSARNFMLYQRPTKDSMDMWADTVDDSSYTWDNFFPYFLKSVDFTPPNPENIPSNVTISWNPSSISSTGGPLGVAYPNFIFALSSWTVKAFQSLGFKSTTDTISGDLIGYAHNMYTIDGPTQTRSTSESSFLRTAMSDLDNLLVYKNTIGQQILFDGNKTATGVIVETAGSKYTLSANKEVILSAGAFRSPQLLMISGIGPQAILDEFDIPVVAQLEGIGQNMWDHILYSITHEVAIETHSQLLDASFGATQAELYNTNRTGYLTSPGVDIIGWEKFSSFNSTLSNSTSSSLASTFPADWPNVEYIFQDLFAGNNSDFILESPKDGKNYAANSVALITPFSRGNVTLASTDTNDNPIVNPNWLTDARDKEQAIAMVKRGRAVWNTPALRQISLGEVYPGPDVQTDDEIWASIQGSMIEVWHASGTCKMSTEDDEMGVVDTKGRVFGVKGVRVVDASAFPFLTPGHPQCVCYALAEKIAQDILDGL